jgi:hypothetical protein
MRLQNSYLSNFFIFVLIMFISGCGGGGGQTTQSSTNQVPPDQQAKINSSSSEEFLAGLNLWFSRTLVEFVVNSYIDGSLIYQTGDITLNLVNPCGGSVQISGSLDETSSNGLLTLDFLNYQHCHWNFTYTFTGTIDLSIFNTEIYSDGGNITIPSEFLFSTDNLVITVRSESVKMDGILEYTHDTSDTQYNWVTYIKNFTLSNSTGSAAFINFVHKTYTSKGNVSPSSYFGFSYSGRLYDSESGYVDVAMVNAVATCRAGGGSSCPLDPTLEGRVKLIGDNSSALIQLGVNFDTINIDADGNGDYEQILQCNEPCN